VAVEDQHVGLAQLAQRTDDPLGHGRVGDADRLAPHAGRVGERPEEVEGGGHAELPADRPGEAQRGVEPGGEAEADPTSSMQRATPSGARSMTTPSASSTSADPHCDDAARLPCLPPGPPRRPPRGQPWSTRSRCRRGRPRLPQVSITSATSGTGTFSENSHMVRTSAASSDGLSPLARSATANPAICASGGLAAQDGWASPPPRPPAAAPRAGPGAPAVGEQRGLRRSSLSIFPRRRSVHQRSPRSTRRR